jgi:hypothetical protein
LVAQPLDHRQVALDHGDDVMKLDAEVKDAGELEKDIDKY